MATQQQTVLRVQTNIPGAISGSTTYEFLDLYGDIPIKINKSFAELQDISKRNSDYSIGLTLPGSKKNNRFFENFFNVDAQSLYFDATQRVPCGVLLNDESYFTGYLKLNKTSVKDSAVEYDVTLFSNIGDLFGKIGNNLLKDLDYDTDVIGYDYKFNHQFTKFQVSSWVDYNPYSYDYEPLFFYPIVHNGYNYSGDTVLLSGTTTSAITSGVTRLYTTTIAGSYPSNAAAYAAGVKRYRINSPEDGLIDNQLKPALSIRGLITLMFQTYGYTIKSDFFNTPWFRMLYMYGYFSSESTKFSYKVPPKSDAVSNDLAVKLTETFVDDTDPICNNIRTTRTYSIQLVNRDTGVQAYSETPLDIVLLFKYYPCGSTIGTDQNVTVTIPVNATGTTYTWISNQFVRCPSTCKLEYRQNFGVNDSLSDVPEYSDLPPNTIVIYEDNDLIEFDLVIDWNLKQIDILSSIAKKFNLVFVPDPDVPNQIIIEPYNYYIGTGNIHDWTPKISYDKGFTVEPALNYVESELILSDLEDGDYGNKTFKDRNNRLYGENKVYNPTAFKSQTKKIDTVFSPELVRQWDTIDTAPNANVKLPLGINYSSSSSSQNSGGSESIVWTYPGVKTKPKLMYWTGNFNPFLDQVGEAITLTGGTVLTNVFYVAESDGDSPRQSFVAPIIGTTMPVGNPDGNKINNDSICNLFNSELPTDIGVTAFSAYTENDAYSIFYQNRVENLYDPNTRFLNGYFNLNYSDIKNLKPNDLIKINEQYFTWNKIDGFNLTNPELTKVELVQANNNPSVYPTRYFQYYYCDNPSTVFKFETDFTNPSLSGTSFGWSATYDYNVGLLGGNVSGYTSTMRDFVQSPNDTIPYYIYEVSESTYNTNGFDRSYDTMWTYLSNLNGDLNPSNFPTYAYGATKIVTNVFTDCANFNYYASTYTIPTGSSTYHGNPVSQTPTPTPTPTPTSNVAERMRGSLLITYREPNANTYTTYVNVLVNGVNRQVTHNDIDDLYSTYIYSGDVVNIKITTTSNVNSLDVTRRDYTTDAQGGDNGIRDTFITGTTGNSVGGFYQITFTAEPDILDYNFEYLVDAVTSFPVTPTQTPTNTPTPSITATKTPTPTPTNTVTPTITPTVTPSSNIGPAILNLNYLYYNGGETTAHKVDFYSTPGNELIGTYTNTGQTGSTVLSLTLPNSYIGQTNYGLSLVWCTVNQPIGVTANTGWEVIVDGTHIANDTDNRTNIPQCPTTIQAGFGVVGAPPLNYNDNIVWNLTTSYGNTASPALKQYYNALDSTSYPGTGSTWYDMSYNNIPALLVNNPTFVSSSPKYFSFNGIDNYCDTQASIGSPGNNISFGGWVKTTQSATEKCFFIKGPDAPFPSTDKWMFKLCKNSSNKFEYAIRNTSLQTLSCTGTTTLQNDTWYFIMGTQDTSNKTIKLYVNGVLESSNSSIISFNQYSFPGVKMGRNTDGTYSQVDVSQYSIYIGYNTDYVLTSADILNLYNQEVANYPLPTPTPTPTSTVTPTPTQTPVTPTPTSTPGATPSVTPTNTMTPSVTPTNTPTNTVTPSVTPSVTPTNTVTPTVTPTNTVTPTVTQTPTSTVTPSVTPTLTPTNTVTPSVTPTLTPTNTVTPTPSITPSATPLPVTIQYYYSVGSLGAPSRAKNVTNNYASGNGMPVFDITLSNISSTAGGTRTGSVSIFDWSGYVFVTRAIARASSGSGTATVNSSVIRLYINGVLYTSYSLGTPFNLSTTARTDSKYFEFIPYNAGDTIRVEWIES